MTKVGRGMTEVGRRMAKVGRTHTHTNMQARKHTRMRTHIVCLYMYMCVSAYVYV